VRILTLCTGNVARSVMLAYMLGDLAEASGFTWHVRSAGTHAIEGLAMSSRTRDALLSIPDLGDHRYGQHRSHQVTADDCRWADVILAAEFAHVSYVRENVDAGVAATTLGHFVAHAPVEVTLRDQLVALDAVEIDDELDVVDPAGGDQLDYDRCACHLWSLAQGFAQRAARSR
jgi:protein-tyrosine-phosphatase